MPMRRDEELQPTYPYALLHPTEVSRLQSIFRRALNVAFASSLMAAGCTVTHGNEPGDQQQAGASGEADPGSAGRSGAAGKKPPVPIAGSAGSHPNSPPSSGTSGTGSKPQDAPPTRDAGEPSEELDSGSASADAGTSVAPVCDGTTYRALAELEATTQFDYAALRTKHQNGTGMIQQRASEGTACEAASQLDACKAALAALDENLTFNTGCGMVGACVHYVVTTQGDEVRRYASFEELVQFLGTIDTPQEALLLLTYRQYQVSCDKTRVRTVADGFEADVVMRVMDCPVTNADVTMHVSAAGVITERARTLQPATNLCIGRRPEGLLATGAADSCSELGRHFAEIAHLEAASIAAFEVLAQELEHHRAPASLIHAARAAARDEVRHAARTSQLARRFGARAQAPRVEERPLRDLPALALDNAVEGCVRETFGALVGTYQANAARDPEIAALMREIAIDETRHAALAQEIHRWVWPKLSGDVRSRISRAQAEAVSALSHELRAEPSRVVRELAGVPDATAAAKLHSVMREELWS